MSSLEKDVTKWIVGIIVSLLVGGVILVVTVIIGSFIFENVLVGAGFSVIATLLGSGFVFWEIIRER